MSSREEEKQYRAHADASGLVSRLGAYAKLSGPGWLQSAITLGGGSLASSLFLGVLAGTSLLWLQPVAIILGVIMLCAISHVTLSTGQSPFVSINREINPVLGWGWAVATIMANIVWCLPQFNPALPPTQNKSQSGYARRKGRHLRRSFDFGHDRHLDFRPRIQRSEVF